MSRLIMITGVVCILVGLYTIVFKDNLGDWLHSPKAQLNRTKGYLEQKTPGALQKALEDLASIITNFPGTEEYNEARLLLAESYDSLGFKELALRKYNQLIEDGVPNDLMNKVHFHIAKLQVATSYSEEAKDRLLHLLSNTTDKVLRAQAYVELGLLEFRRGSLEKAKKNFEIALHEDPKNHSARVQLARVLSAMGNGKDAADVYQYYLTYHSALDENRDEHTKLLHDHVLGLLKKSTKEEQSSSSEALQIPLKVEDMLDVKRVKQQLSFKQCLEYYQSAKYYDALTCLKTVLAMIDRSTMSEVEKSKEREIVLYYLAEASYEFKQYEVSIQYYTKVIQNQDLLKDEEAWLKKGQVLFHLKRYKESATIFTNYKKQFPKGLYVPIVNDWLDEIENIITEQVRLDEKSREQIEHNLNNQNNLLEREPVDSSISTLNDTNKNIEEPSFHTSSSRDTQQKKENLSPNYIHIPRSRRSDDHGVQFPDSWIPEYRSWFDQE